MKKKGVRLARSILGIVMALTLVLLMPLMLWDLLVLGLPSEGGLSMMRRGPSSFELMTMLSIWIGSFAVTLWHSYIKPAWDNYIGYFLDLIGLYGIYKWIKRKRFKSENKSS